MQNVEIMLKDSWFDVININNASALLQTTLPEPHAHV